MPQAFGELGLRIVADDKIAAAYREGLFDQLPGFGQPHPVFDESFDLGAWTRERLAEIPQAPGKR